MPRPKTLLVPPGRHHHRPPLHPTASGFALPPVLFVWPAPAPMPTPPPPPSPQSVAPSSPVTALPRRGAGLRAPRHPHPPPRTRRAVPRLPQRTPCLRPLSCTGLQGVRGCGCGCAKWTAPDGGPSLRAGRRNTVAAAGRAAGSGWGRRVVDASQMNGGCAALSRAAVDGSPTRRRRVGGFALLRSYVYMCGSMLLSASVPVSLTKVEFVGPNMH